MTATNASPPQYPPDAREPGEPVPVFVLNGTRTSGGPGPGVKHLPPAEAASLTARKLAVAGDQPPRGWPG